MNEKDDTLDHIINNNDNIFNDELVFGEATEETESMLKSDIVTSSSATTTITTTTTTTTTTSTSTTTTTTTTTSTTITPTTKSNGKYEIIMILFLGLCCIKFKNEFKNTFLQIKIIILLHQKTITKTV